jgi:hypothetical protein
MNLCKELERLDKEREELVKKVDTARSRLKFKCACGKMHSIQSCDVVQTHWYTAPHGCTGGDYWNEGELQIVCPDTAIRNRVMFDSYFQVQWQLRNDYAYNLEHQFSRKYKDLFKSVIDEHDNDRCAGGKYASFNNYYFEKKKEKFGLKIKSDGYEK